MIVILKPGIDKAGADYTTLMNFLTNQPGIQVRVHEEKGSQQVLTELYLVGDTKSLDQDDIKVLPGVERVVRVSQEYRVLGRHKDDNRPTFFEYNGVTFSQDNLNIFAGLCAVDNPTHVEQMMKVLQEHGLTTTRMGAYKPRTSPYAFQGHGASCLPYVFELAGKYGIKVIAMEVTSEHHVAEIKNALET